MFSNIPFIVYCRKVTEAAEKQMKKLWHTTNIYMQPAIHEYARKLAQKLPEHLKVDNNVDKPFNKHDLYE